MVDPKHVLLLMFCHGYCLISGPVSEYNYCVYTLADLVASQPTQTVSHNMLMCFLGICL